MSEHMLRIKFLAPLPGIEPGVTRVIGWNTHDPNQEKGMEEHVVEQDEEIESAKPITLNKLFTLELINSQSA